MNEKPIAVIIVRVWPNGALSVEGPVADRAWCSAALENAADAVRNNGRQEQVIAPSSSVSLP